MTLSTFGEFEILKKKEIYLDTEKAIRRKG